MVTLKAGTPNKAIRTAALSVLTYDALAMMPCSCPSETCSDPGVNVPVKVLLTSIDVLEKCCKGDSGGDGVGVNA